MYVSLTRLGLSLLVPTVIAGWGYRRKSLNVSGALLALLVGFIVTLSNGCFCLALLTFFFSSSRLTKWKSHTKRQLDPEFKKGGQRDWKQVFCNGSVLSVVCVLHMLQNGPGEVPLIFTCTRPFPSWSTVLCVSGLSALSCCCGDTWASEIGSVAGGRPKLVTSGRTVPVGTNGGITSLGLAVSLLGGMSVGVAYYCGICLFVGLDGASSQWLIIFIGALAGLFGSIVDSFLGATLQYSGYHEEDQVVLSKPGPNVRHISGLNVMTNNSVNFVSSLITSLFMPLLLFIYCQI